MIDHFNLPVSNLETSRVFYETVLHELGHVVLMVDGDAVGFGSESWAFGIAQEKSPISRIHLAFRAQSRNAVQSFYNAALAAGAQCNGPPGLRPQFGPAYYAAFVYDFDGHNVEAVCRS